MSTQRTAVRRILVIPARRRSSRLPDKMQRVIRCVKIEGLSVTEAARRCGMSERSTSTAG